MRTEMERGLALADALQQPVWTLRLDGTVDYTNPFWQTYTGITGAAALDNGWSAAVHPDDVASVQAKFAQAASTSEPYEVEYRFRRADGAYRWHLARLAPLCDPEGVLIGWAATALDIDDRRRAEAALQASETHYRNVIDNVNDIVYTLHLDGRVKSINPAVERILGYRPDELLDRPVERILAPDQVVRTREVLARKLAGVERSVYELEVRAKDGRQLTLEIDSSLALVEGQPVAIHGIARDVSGRKRAEARLHVLAEASQLLASDLDVDARLAAVARQVVPTLADWCVVDVVEEGSTLRRVAVAHADPAKVAMAEELQRRYALDPDAPVGPSRVLRTGQPELVSEIPDDLLAAHAHDAEHLALLRGVGLRSYVVVPLRARGRILGTLTLIAAESGVRYGRQDLALAEALAEPAALAIDNARLYEAVAAAEVRYRGLFHGVADAILVADAERRYLDLNRAAEALLRYRRDDLVGRRVDDIVVAEPNWTPEEYERFMQDGVWRGELEVRRSDGEVVSVEAQATTVALPDGEVYLSALRDISSRKRTERFQRDFIAMLGHDLRTPLTTIRATAQLAARRGGYRPETIITIVDQVDRMRRMIDDLTEMVGLEAGEVHLRRSPVDLMHVARDVAAATRMQSEQQQVRIESQEATVVGEWDRDRLVQVMQNLLGNAVKYAPDGEVVIRIVDRSSEVHVSVIDSGAGIVPGHLPHLFERFYRADVTGAGGLGLGLYISRMLVEAHGGRIWAESAPGKGATFTFTLPRI
ncbi:MAG: PAS domain S-box protein [Chloroflexota bacterium]|nr:PAS domain S-box protein [Chloroflexota bacterium]